jgi:EmrB/QacA subfamily drug resistance transporter
MKVTSRSRALAAWRARSAARPGWKWLILSTVLLGATMSALDVSIVNVALPTLKRTFGVSMAVVEWVAIAYMLALTIFLPLFGRLADVFGRSRLYNLGFAVFSAGSLLCAVSPSAGALIAARAIQAIGAGLLQANSVAIITHAFPAEERGKAIGIQGGVQAIVMAVAPFFGGILVTALGWRAIFAVNIPIGILGIVAGLLVLPADGERKEAKVDYLGAALFAGGLGSLLLALNEIVKLGWESPAVAAFFAGGVVLLSLFVITELRVRQPLIDLRLFKNSTFLLGNVSGMLSYYVLFAVMFLMPFYLERVRGYGVATTGVLLTPLLLAMAVAAPLSGRISDRYGSRLMTTAGTTISALACLWLLSMGSSPSMRVMVGMMIALGLGMGTFIPSNNSAVMGAAPGEKLGMAGGLLNMTRSLGLIFGVNVSGLVFTTLEHRYLAQKGFPDAGRAFSNPSIPMPAKADAFVHAFMVVVLVLLVLNVVAALLSLVRKAPAAGVLDRELAGAVVISTGFFHGFDPETAGVAILVAALLLAGYLGLFALGPARGRAAAAAGAIAAAAPARAGPAAHDPASVARDYYARRYHDADVSIDVRPVGDHFEADVRKFGFLVKTLEVRGDAVQERRTGLRGWGPEQLILVN